MIKGADTTISATVVKTPMSSIYNKPKFLKLMLPWFREDLTTGPSFGNCINPQCTITIKYQRLINLAISGQLLLEGTTAMALILQLLVTQPLTCQRKDLAGLKHYYSTYESVRWWTVVAITVHTILYSHQ